MLVPLLSSLLLPSPPPVSEASSNGESGGGEDGEDRRQEDPLSAAVVPRTLSREDNRASEQESCNTGLDLLHLPTVSHFSCRGGEDAERQGRRPGR
jgi:hypothetical protein